MSFPSIGSRLQQLVYSMLTENTGAHFLDSGGAYGRNHERNRLKTLDDFRSEDLERYEIDFDTKHPYIERTVSVFQYLAGDGTNLELDEYCDTFNRLVDMAQNSDDATMNQYADDCPYYGVLRPCWEYLQSLEDFEECKRMIGWGSNSREETFTFNTYNHDSDLTQVLQGGYCKIDDDVYLILQIHGGCDVRGGYTDARLFRVGGYDEFMIHEYIYDYEDHDSRVEKLRECDIEFHVEGQDVAICYSELDDELTEKFDNL